jgi:endogenous inhibitor of DNA gyrase (YacG/DUF329 family)
MTPDADSPAPDSSASDPLSTCPICGKPSAHGRIAPFCSARCADVDLGRWLTGHYRIAGPIAEDDAPDDGAPEGPA